VGAQLLLQLELRKIIVYFKIDTMRIENSNNIVELKSCMINSIQDLDYWALGFFQQVIENRKLAIEKEQSVNNILYLCKTGKDFYESVEER
jgi:hypothetical protein